MRDDVIELLIVFNIIFIMRTNMGSGRIQRFVDLVVLVDFGGFLLFSPQPPRALLKLTANHQASAPIPIFAKLYALRIYLWSNYY
jgi:hypothetical protein